MQMNWGHYVMLAVILLAGFYIGKHYPSMFASIPGLNAL